jgi:4'-phosphopantetheinyl transferase
MPSGWLTRSSADVAAGEAWLGPRERAVLAGLTVPKRRDDWRLGRWTAKAALAAWLGVDRARLEVLAAADGAPEAWLDGAPAPVSVSLSHRAGLALAVVADPPALVGCDLELLEPRSPAFIEDWLAPSEQELAEVDPLLFANLAWTAKEAAAKVRREGLRLDVRGAVTRLREAEPVEGWSRLTIEWAGEGRATAGWWREASGWVLCVAEEPESGPPRPLDGPSQ